MKRTRLAKALDGPMRQHMKYSGGRYVTKASWPTKQMAEKNTLHDKDLTAYQCRICHRWHIGH